MAPVTVYALLLLYFFSEHLAQQCLCHELSSGNNEDYKGGSGSEEEGQLWHLQGTEPADWELRCP